MTAFTSRLLASSGLAHRLPSPLLISGALALTLSACSSAQSQPEPVPVTVSPAASASTTTRPIPIAGTEDAYLSGPEGDVYLEEDGTPVTAAPVDLPKISLQVTKVAHADTFFFGNEPTVAPEGYEAVSFEFEIRSNQAETSAAIVNFDATIDGKRREIDQINGSGMTYWIVAVVPKGDTDATVDIKVDSQGPYRWNLHTGAPVS